MPRLAGVWNAEVPGRPEDAPIRVERIWETMEREVASPARAPWMMVPFESFLEAAASL